jgi:hypothetical protein
MDHLINGEQPMKHIDTMQQAADHVLRGSNDINVVVGPLVWKPSDGKASKAWYFTVATSEKRRGFRCDQITIGDGIQRDEARQSFLLALTRRKALVAHDTDDELYMAKLCEALWPGERITRLRKHIEAERIAAREAGHPNSSAQA